MDSSSLFNVKARIQLTISIPFGVADKPLGQSRPRNRRSKRHWPHDLRRLRAKRSKSLHLLPRHQSLRASLQRNERLGYLSFSPSLPLSPLTSPAQPLLQHLQQSLGKGSAHAIPADFYKLEDCKRLAEELKKREPKLHVRVNNSGSNWGAPFDEFPDSAWTRVLTLNLTRVFTITQAVTPLLEAAATKDDPARIINIGSVDGLRVPSLETFSYSASKAGLHQLSRVLANHLGKRNITSNALACGPFESKMMAATLKTFGETIVAGIPLGRIGSPEDVAGACLFLSSRAGAFVNGATIALDGGSLVGSKL
jgi:NAD(P)-dependent dehydrogenase (short-subunit alcohol dehydrogenase family)